MSTLQAATLITHVLAGIAGIGLLNLLAMHFLKRAPNFSFLAGVAWSAAGLFWLSFATSAYYYVTYYGKAVKPRILEGSLPFAHTFFMEAKEHVFLIVPFLALALALLISGLKRAPDKGVQRAGLYLSLVALAIGVFVAAAGIIVSGSTGSS